MTDVNQFFNGKSDEILCIDKFVGDETCSQISERLKEDKKIKRIVLRGNCIGPDGAYSISEMLSVNSYISFLSLEWNEVGSIGVSHIAVALETNLSLTNLDLRNNGIGNDGAIALASALNHNNTLQVLDLRFNQIGDSGGQYFERILSERLNKLDLLLGGNLISPPVIAKIEKVLRRDSDEESSPDDSSLISDQRQPSPSRSLSPSRVINSRNITPSRFRRSLSNQSNSSNRSNSNTRPHLITTNDYELDSSSRSRRISYPSSSSQSNRLDESIGRQNSLNNTNHSNAGSHMGVGVGFDELGLSGHGSAHGSMLGGSTHGGSTHSSKRSTQGNSALRIIELEQLLAREKYRAEQTMDSLKVAKTRINDQANEIVKIKARWEQERAQITEEVDRMTKENEQEVKRLTSERNSLADKLDKAELIEHQLRDQIVSLSTRVGELEIIETRLNTEIKLSQEANQRTTIQMNLMFDEFESTRQDLIKETEKRIDAERKKANEEINSILEEGKRNLDETLSRDQQKHESIYESLRRELDAQRHFFEMERIKLAEEAKMLLDGKDEDMRALSHRLKTTEDNLTETSENLRESVDLVSRLTKEIGDMEASYKHKLESAEFEFQQLEIEYNEETQRLNQELDSARVASQRAVLAEVAKGEVEIQALRDEHDRVLVELRTQFEERETTLREQLAHTESSLQEKLAELQGSLVDTTREMTERAERTEASLRDQIRITEITLREQLEMTERMAAEELEMSKATMSREYAEMEKQLQEEIEIYKYEIDEFQRQLPIRVDQAIDHTREELTNHYNEEIAELRGELLEEKESIIIQGQQLKEAYELQVQGLQKRVSELEEYCHKLEKDVEKLMEEHKVNLEDVVKQTHEENRVKYEAILREERTQHQKLLQDTKSKYEENLQDRIKKDDEILKETVKMCEDRVEEALRRRDEEHSVVVEAGKVALQEAISKHEESVRTYGQRIQDILTKHETELQEMSSNYETRLEEQRVETETVKLYLERQLAELKREIVNTVEQKTEEFEVLLQEKNRLKELAKAREEEIYRLTVELDTAKRDFNEKDTKNVDSLAELHVLVSNLKEEAIKAIQNEKEKGEMAVKHVQEEMAFKLRAAEVNLEQVRAELQRVKYDAEALRRELPESIAAAAQAVRQDLNKQHELEVEELNKRLKAEHASALDKVRDDFGQRIYDKDAQLRNMTTQRDVLRERLESTDNQLARMDSEFGILKKVHREQVESMGTQLVVSNAKITELEATRDRLAKDNENLQEGLERAALHISELQLDGESKRELYEKTTTELQETSEMRLQELTEKTTTEITELKKNVSILENELEIQKQETAASAQMARQSAEMLESLTKGHALEFARCESEWSSKLQNRESALQRSFSELEVVKQKLEATETELTRIQGDLQKSQEDLYRANRQCKEDVEGLRAQNVILKSELSEAETAKTRLRHDFETKVLALERAALQISRLECDLANSREDIAKRAMEHDGLNERLIQSVEDAIAATKAEEAERYKLLLNEKEERAMVLASQRDSMKLRLETLEVELARLNQTANTAEALQKEQTSMNATVDFLSDLLRRAEADLLHTRTELEETKQLHLQKIEQMQRQFIHQEKEFEDKLHRCEQTSKDRLDKILSDMLNGEELQKDQIDRLKSEYEHNINAANQQTERVLQELLSADSAHKEQLEKLEIIHKKQMEALEHELKHAEVSHKESLDRMRNSFETAEKLHKRQIENLRNELLGTELTRNEHTERLEAFHKKQLEQLQNDLRRMEESYVELKAENEQLSSMSNRILDLEKQRNSKFEESIAERLETVLATERKRYEGLLQEARMKLEESAVSKTKLEEYYKNLLTDREQSGGGDSTEAGKLRTEIEELKKSLEQKGVLERDLRDSVVSLTLQNSAYFSQLRNLQQQQESHDPSTISAPNVTTRKLEAQVKSLEEKLATVQTKRREDFSLYQKRLTRILQSGGTDGRTGTGTGTGTGQPSSMIDDFLRDIDYSDETCVDQTDGLDSIPVGDYGQGVSAEFLPKK